MVSIKRTSNNPYTIEFGEVPLKEVALSAKPMSIDYFNKEGNHVSQNSLIILNLLSENYRNLYSSKKYLQKEAQVQNDLSELLINKI